MSTVPAIDTTDPIYTNTIQLRKEGWNVKYERDKGRLTKVLANKDYVNMRGHWSNYPSPGTWVFEFFVRNKNGGYASYRDGNAYNTNHFSIEQIISKAKELFANGGPDIPEWDRDKLPEPFSFSDMVYYKIRKFGYVAPGERKHQNKTGLSIECLVQNITIVGIVAINKDCTITEEAAIVPNNTAWFMLECAGTCGRFTILSNGDQFYPVRITAARQYKVSLDTHLDRIDTAKLNVRDQLNIKFAIKEYIKLNHNSA